MESRLALPANTNLDGSYRIVRVVGSGGFGITYEAEDVKLGMTVALKEYYPIDFGDRDSTMSVKPKSDRHQKTFQWGRSNFLQEARTLARFEHPSIVRVTRVFEANSTAYMVMNFERGQSFDHWLDSLGRPPTQEELDRIAAPLLDALQMMHAANFLHRDIAPDNIIVRADGTPVLLDFGAARRAVAEMSRALTGIVKAGYSPHEQYSTDSRLQGPWSDLYALGGTFYRAVTGSAPEEAALRVDEDHMAPAALAAKGKYRPSFLAGIDACLTVRHSQRPRSVAQLRPLLFGQTPPPKPVSERPPSTPRVTSAPLQTRKVAAGSRPRSGRRLAIAAALLAVLGGAYGGFEFMRWQPAGPGTADSETKRLAAEAETRRQAAADAAQRQANVDAERRRHEEAMAAQRQADLDAERRRQDAAAAARRQADLDAERLRQEMAEVARRQTEAEQRHKEEMARIAAESRQIEEARRASAAEARQMEEERTRVAAATLTAEERATYVKRIQTALKQSQCYDGAANGRIGDTQEGLDRYLLGSDQKGKARPPRLELAKATASDFDAWLRHAEELKGDICAAKPKPAKPEVARTKPEVAKPPRRREESQRARVERPAPEPREAPQKLCWGYKQELKPC